MELVELKSVWKELNEKVEKQQTFNDKMITEIIRMKYKNKINSILKYEGLSTAVLLFALLVIIWNINIFNTIPLKISVVVCIIIMISLPVLSLSSVYRLHSLDVSKRNIKETLLEFTKRRTRFLMIQKWSVVLSAIFMLAIIPVTLKIAKGKDFFESGSNNILWFIPIALLVFIFFARWVYNCYSSITLDAKEALKDFKE